MVRRKTRRGFRGRRKTEPSKMIIALIVLAAAVAGFLAMDAAAFAMTQLSGDAFIRLSGVMFDGHYFRDADKTCKYYVYNQGYGCAAQDQPPYQKVFVFNVGGKGLYVTPAGFLVEKIQAKQFYYLKTDCYYYYGKRGNDAEYQECMQGQKVSEAWVWIQLDTSKLAGGTPILVAVGDQDIEAIISSKASQSTFYSKVSQSAYEYGKGYAPSFAEELYEVAKLGSGVIEGTVPFQWFPENGTIKFKVTGLMGWMPNGYGYFPPILTYQIYFAPPGGKLYTAEIVTVKAASVKDVGYWTRWTVAGSTYSCYWGTCTARAATYSEYVAKYTTIPAQVETRLKIVAAPTTLAPETYTTAKEVVSISGLEVVRTSVTTVETGVRQSVQELDIPPATTIAANKTMATATFPLTVEAPKTTVVIQRPEQVAQVNQLYQPPKPLYQIIDETLQSWWRGLLDWLQGLFKA
jgi:hypothetical protein